MVRTTNGAVIMPSEPLIFRHRASAPLRVRERRTRSRQPPRLESFPGERVLWDLDEAVSEPLVAIRIIARYAALRALVQPEGPLAAEARTVAFAYLAALDGAVEARALRRALVSVPGSRVRFRALMAAGMEADRWGHVNGATVLRRVAWDLARAGRHRLAAARAARSLATTYGRAGQPRNAAAWARRWRRLSAAERDS
jgi:hypothetical protein